MVLVKVDGREFELKERELILAEGKRNDAPAFLAITDSFSAVDSNRRIYFNGPVFRLNHYAHSPQVSLVTKPSVLDSNLRLLRVGPLEVYDCLYARSYKQLAAVVKGAQPPYDLSDLIRNFK